MDNAAAASGVGYLMAAERVSHGSLRWKNLLNCSVPAVSRLYQLVKVPKLS